MLVEGYWRGERHRADLTTDCLIRSEIRRSVIWGWRPHLEQGKTINYSMGTLKNTCKCIWMYKQLSDYVACMFVRGKLWQETACRGFETLFASVQIWNIEIRDFSCSAYDLISNERSFGSFPRYIDRKNKYKRSVNCSIILISLFKNWIPWHDTPIYMDHKTQLTKQKSTYLLSSYYFSSLLFYNFIFIIMQSTYAPDLLNENTCLLFKMI